MTERAVRYLARGTVTPDRGAVPGALAINRNGPVPFYAQLAEILRSQIADGRWGPGDALPSEADLCAAYAISRTAVRQALDELVAEGLVVKERGRGTFVARPKIADLVVHELRGFHDEMSARGHDVTTTILQQQIEPAVPIVAIELGVEAGTPVVHLARIRSAGPDPVVKVDTWVLASRAPGLERADLEGRSLYDELRTRYGIEPAGGWRRIEAAVASRELATALGVDVGSPILHLTAVTMDRDGAFEFFTAFYRGDRTSFEIRA